MKHLLIQVLAEATTNLKTALANADLSDQIFKLLADDSAVAPKMCATRTAP